LDLSKAVWDAMGKRVIPVASETEEAKERRRREKEAERARKEAEREAAYVAETGDSRGFLGFVKAGERLLTAEELRAQQLVKLGFAADVARKAAEASNLNSVEDSIALAQSIAIQLQEGEKKAADKRLAQQQQQQQQQQAKREKSAANAPADASSVSPTGADIKSFLFKDAGASGAAATASNEEGAGQGSREAGEGGGGGGGGSAAFLEAVASGSSTQMPRRPVAAVHPHAPIVIPPPPPLPHLLIPQVVFSV
jgi:hypothetical protein